MSAESDPHRCLDQHSVQCKGAADYGTGRNAVGIIDVRRIGHTSVCNQIHCRLTGGT